MNAFLRSRHLSVRAKVSALAAVVVTCVMLLSCLVLYVGIERVLIDNTANNLRISAAGAIGGVINGPGSRRDSGSLPLPPLPIVPSGTANGAAPPFDATRSLTDLARFLTTRDTAVLTTDISGATVGDGPVLAGIGTVTAPHLAPAVYQEVATTNQERHVVAQTKTGPVLIELVPLVRETVSPAQTVGVLELSTSLEGVETFLRLLRALLTGVVLVAVITTAVLLFLLVAGLLRPLRQMEGTSRAIAAGDLTLRVPVPRGDDELTHLARAFNEMVERLEITFAAQRRFVADASHELRSPLAALGNGIEMLIFGADQADPGARTRLLRLLESEINRMTRLVDDLLTLSRFDTIPLDSAERAPLDLTLLVGEVAEVTRLLAPDRTVCLEGVTDSAIIIAGDADQLRQAVLNLCANARAYTRPGGTITLGLRRRAQEVILTVQDTGSGIAPADLSRVWHRFYRADPARARQAGQGGMGLGLAIVHAVVEAHGGTAAITSTVGVGTAVTLTFPIPPQHDHFRHLVTQQAAVIHR